MKPIFLLRQPSGGVSVNDFLKKGQKGLIWTEEQGVYLHQKNVIDCF